MLTNPKQSDLGLQLLLQSNNGLNCLQLLLNLLNTLLFGKTTLLKIYYYSSVTILRIFTAIEKIKTKTVFTPKALPINLIMIFKNNFSKA